MIFLILFQCSFSAMKDILEKVKIKFVTVQPGDYAVKAGLDSTIAHRNAMISILDFVTEDPRFVVLYHDELNMTVNLGQTRAWMKSGEVHVDLRKKSGAGQGTIMFNLFFCFMFLLRYWCICFPGHDCAWYPAATG